jgi:putative membrane protein
VKRIPFVATSIVLAAFAPALASAALAATATPVDAAFVATVSQGGMFEVAAGKLALERGSTQDIRDFGAMEVHDHELVGAKLTSVSNSEGLTFPSNLNPGFRGKLDHLMALSGPAFDAAYMTQMSTLHAADGAAFAKESSDGGSPAYRAFGAETHVIVQRHIGAIDGAPPP